MPAETPRTEGDPRPDRLTPEPPADAETHAEEPPTVERLITEFHSELLPGGPEADFEGEKEEEPTTFLQGKITEIRARLRPGGPPVDRRSILAYLAGALAGDEKRLVSERIETWWDWFDAWRDLLPATDPDPSDSSATPFISPESQQTPANGTQGTERVETPLDIDKLITAETPQPEQRQPDRSPEEPPTELERMIAKARSRLREGGPAVHDPALCAFVAGVLEEGERRLVAEHIATWRNWFEEYLLLLDADAKVWEADFEAEDDLPSSDTAVP